MVVMNTKLGEGSLLCLNSKGLSTFAVAEVRLLEKRSGCLLRLVIHFSSLLYVV